MGISRELTLSANTQLIHQLFYFLDEFDYASLAALFTPKGIWRRQGEVLVGAEQIERALLKRSSTQRIRHVISNVFLASYESNTATVIAYMTAYRFDDGTKKSGPEASSPVAISKPFLLSVVRAKVELVADTWLVAEMDMLPQFEFLADCTH